MGHEPRLPLNAFMKLIDRNTRSPRSGAFLRCPFCQGITKVYNFSWSALGCTHCGDMINKPFWAVCDRSELTPVEIVAACGAITLRDGSDWCSWMPNGDHVISMYGVGGHDRHVRNRVEGRIQVTMEVALRQVQTHMEYGWTVDCRGKGQL